MNDLVPITLTDRLALSKITLAPSVTISPIELTNRVNTVRIAAAPIAVVIANPATPIDVSIAEIMRGPAGPPGPQGPTGGAASFVYTQQSASDRWTIQHNLGSFPAVTVIDSAGDWMIADFSFISPDMLEIKFAVATSGTAYLR